MADNKLFKFYHKDNSVKRLRGISPVEAFTKAGYAQTDLNQFEGFEEVTLQQNPSLVIKGKVNPESTGFLADVVDLYESDLGLHPSTLMDTFEKLLRNFESMEVVSTNTGEVYLIGDKELTQGLTTMVDNTAKGELNNPALTDIINYQNGQAVVCNMWWDINNGWIAVIGKDNAEAVFSSIWDEFISRTNPIIDPALEEAITRKMVAFG
jgi:hypothetical protein